MNKIYSALLTLLSFPLLAFAEDNLQNFVINILKFINGTLIPFTLTIAFLFFIINVVRFFIIGGSNEEGRERAKALAVYSVATFVIILIFWGIVVLVAESIGLEGCTAPKSDYVNRNFVGPSLPDCS